MKLVKRIVSFLLVLVLVSSVIPESKVFTEAAEMKKSILSVETKNAVPGSTVVMEVKIKDNPGVLGMVLRVDYNAKLQLTDAKSGEAFAPLVMTKPGKYTSSSKFTWDGQELKEEDIRDGIILVLTFRVSDEAKEGEKLNINIYCENAVNSDLNDLNIITENGYINVLDYTPGDLNEDGKINSTDVILMRREIAGGYEQAVNKSAADVNGDNKVNSTDVILVRRYIAGGYDVNLVGPGNTHIHTMETIVSKKPTCTEAGNIEYWHCLDCAKFYSDVNGLNQILLEETIIPAKGHTPVIDKAVAATYDATGLTEGSHCGECNTVLVKQDVIPKLERTEYPIIYHLYEDDNYLKTIDIENKNPDSYYSEEGLKLSNIKVDGYIFDGWYDGEGANAELVKQIPAGETGEIELYAHWRAREYTVTFDSPLAPTESIKYTVNKGATLINPSWFGYTFMGWSDDEGNIVTRIPQGKTGDITLTANWTSKRNQTRKVKNLGEPLIYEDEENGQYLFTYEIGQIENVPLYEMKNFGNRSGLDVSETITTSNSISEGTANSIVNTIANATTKTSAWTLSKDWNDSLTEIISHTDESGQEVIDSTSSVSSSDEIKITGSQEGGNKVNTKTTSKEDELTAKVTGKVEGNIGAGKASIEVEAGGSHSEGTDKTKSKTKTWNDTESTQNSTSSSTNHTTSTALSKKVSDTYGYNKTHSEGGSESVATSNSATSSESNEYASTLTYSNQITETTSRTYSNSNAPEGYYRLVCAGTIHVFAVVGYDVATSSYYVYSFSVQDDKTYDFVDYSKDTPNFNDYENGVLPFEIPYFVNEYINEAIEETEGLIVDKSTGFISGYTGTSKNVVVPDYITLDSVNGKKEVVKIVGVDNNAFANNTTITSVKFGKYITEIPNSAFEGCTSLKSIICPSVIKIGDKAFYNCSSLERYNLTDKVTKIGDSAFNNVKHIDASVNNIQSVQAVCNSGAKEIVLNISNLSEKLENTAIAIPNTTDYFELNGGKKTFNNLLISSKAKTTVLNELNITSDKAAVLDISSNVLKLSSSEINASNWALKLSADKVDMYIDGSVSINTTSNSSILTKNLSIMQLLQNSKAQLNVSNDIYVCGEITGSDLLNVSEGKVVHIDEESYQRLSQDSLEWVLESEVPKGAQILDEKWTYDFKTQITSDKSALEGYTLYDTTWVWGNYGSWSGWSDTKANGSDSRQVETKQVVASTNYKTVYHYYRYAANYSGGVSCYQYYAGGGCTNYYEYNFDSQLSYYSNHDGHSTYKWYYNGSNFVTLYQKSPFTTQEVVSYNYKTQYRYRDRAKVYTYYLYKFDKKESDTAIEATEDISNIQKWVKYVIS